MEKTLQDLALNAHDAWMDAADFRMPKSFVRELVDIANRTKKLWTEYKRGEDMRR